MKKSILITGSTDGIGKLAALQLAEAGHEVYLHGRNAEKLDAVIEEVKKQTNNDAIKGFVADFSDLALVAKMAEEVIATLPKLDVLINNAGIFKSNNPKTKHGLDIRFVVNYLAPYVLTKSLLPLLEKGDAARIINLSSAAQSPVSQAALAGKKQEFEREAYAQSKLALTMWSFDLAKKLDNITVLALNPGSLLNTKMVQEAFGKYWSSADKGSQIIYDLAVANQYKGVTGQYFDNDSGMFAKAHSDAYDGLKIEKLLQWTDTILNG